MKTKILVVEDNINDFETLKKILEQNNYEVLHTGTGEETFHFLEKNVPDLVILDILLPDTDGFEVCKRIRENNQFFSLPVLFYSVIRTIDDKLLGLEMGASDFLPKSAEPRELLVRIKNLLKRKRKLDQVINFPFHDGITKVYSQKYFLHRLQDECMRSKRYKRNLSCAMLNVDKFSLIKDTLGEDVANCVLQKVAEIVKENTRRVDPVCRYGPDEFTVLFPETNLRDAFFATERVRQLLELSNTNHQLCTINVTVSCGVSSFTNDTIDKDDFISQTKAALAKAKADGRNQTKSYSKQFGYG